MFLLSSFDENVVVDAITHNIRYPLIRYVFPKWTSISPTVYENKPTNWKEVLRSLICGGRKWERKQQNIKSFELAIR